ncbi:MAG: thiamine diphosphokinase [Enterococcus italicus]|uniref:thiamine diphosphokinase n=1 Tax=Enterococcus italicus TaxID=246144 RepID=UPI000EC7DF80|nr:thiamine diphosphokinase [Enterococcus sp.]
MNILLVGGAPKETWPSLERAYDYTIGVDRGALFLLEEQSPLNAAIGDFDSLSLAELKRVKEKADSIEQSKPEKDDTDTQLGLLHAIQRYPEATIDMIGLTGGRIDHFLANLWLVLEPRFQPYAMNISLRDRTNTIRFYLPGTYTIEKETGMKYLAYCCLTPMEQLTLTESKYTLDKQKIDYPISYASNEFLTNQASFSFSDGVMAVIQSKD